MNNFKYAKQFVQMLINNKIYSKKKLVFLSVMCGIEIGELKTLSDITTVVEKCLNEDN